MASNDYRRRDGGWATWIMGMALLILVSVVAYYVYVNNLDYTALLPPAQTKVQTRPTQATAGRTAGGTTGRSAPAAQPAGPSTEQQAVRQEAAPVVMQPAPVDAAAPANVTDLPPGYDVDASGQMWKNTVGAPVKVYPTPEPAPEAQLSQDEQQAAAESAEQNMIDSALSGLTPEEQQAAIVAAENNAWNNAPAHVGQP